MSGTCIFCDIAAGLTPAHIVWTDVDFMVFLDRNPMAAGHLLVIPKQHVDKLWDLGESHYLRLMLLVRRLTVPLTKAIGADRAGMAVEGYGVPHAHIHLVPINAGNELDPCRQSPASDPELTVAAEVIRDAIARCFQQSKA